MRFSEFAFLIVKSLNPEEYKILAQRKKRDTVKYFIYLLVLTILMGFIFSIPKIVAAPSKVESILLKFERFNITGLDIQAKEPIVLLSYPKTVLDLTGNTTNMSNEMVLITNKDIMWKKLRPDLFKWKLFETESKQITEYSDVISDVGGIKGGTFWILALILLPSIFFALFLVNFIKYAFIIMFFTFFAYILMKLKRKKARFFTVWRVAVFASSVMLITGIGISPLFNMGIYYNLFPVLLYALMFYLGLLVVTEKDINIKNYENE